jgi:hypothetical protein
MSLQATQRGDEELKKKQEKEQKRKIALQDFCFVLIYTSYLWLSLY